MLAYLVLTWLRSSTRPAPASVRGLREAPGQGGARENRKGEAVRAYATTRISTVAAAWISMGGRNVRRRRGCGLLRVLADLRSRPRVSQAG